MRDPWPCGGCPLGIAYKNGCWRTHRRGHKGHLFRRALRWHTLRGGSRLEQKRATASAGHAVHGGFGRRVLYCRALSNVIPAMAAGAHTCYSNRDATDAGGVRADPGHKHEEKAHTRHASQYRTVRLGSIGVLDVCGSCSVWTSELCGSGGVPVLCARLSAPPVSLNSTLPVL